MATTTETQPRRFNRVSCNAAAVVTTAHDTLAGVCENLSLGGAYVSGAPAPTAKSVTMAFCLPSVGPVEVAGEVRHGTEKGFGIRFTHLPPRALMAICSYVGSLH